MPWSAADNRESLVTTPAALGVQATSPVLRSRSDDDEPRVAIVQGAMTAGGMPASVEERLPSMPWTPPRRSVIVAAPLMTTPPDAPRAAASASVEGPTAFERALMARPAVPSMPAAHEREGALSVHAAGAVGKWVPGNRAPTKASPPELGFLTEL